MAMTKSDYTWLAALLQMAGAPTRELTAQVFQPYFLNNYEAAVFLLNRENLSELESALESAYRAMSRVNSTNAGQKTESIGEILQQVKRAIIAVDARRENQKVG